MHCERRPGFFWLTFEVTGYRNAASSRSSHKKTLFTTVNHIIARTNRKKPAPKTPEAQSPTTIAENQLNAVGGNVRTPNRRSARSAVVRARVERETQLVSVTGSTPKRNMAAKLEEIAAAEEGDRNVQEKMLYRRAQTCTGACRARSDKKRKRCTYCGLQTQFYCVMCKRSLCNGTKASTEASKQETWLGPTIKFSDEEGGDEEFVNTCFLNVHNRAFNEHFQRMDVKKRRV